jgi:hypothetical protein
LADWDEALSDKARSAVEEAVAAVLIELGIEERPFHHAVGGTDA